MCRVLEVPRSTYYKSKHKTQSQRSIENKVFKAEIEAIYQSSSRRYGAPKIYQVMKANGFKLSLKRVQKLMKSLGLKSIVAKKFKPHSGKNIVLERENKLAQDFTTTTINEKWVADITYIHTIKDGWCYLASIMDLHSRKIIGHSFSNSMDTSLVITALDNAYKAQRPTGNVIFHTDLGTQYTSDKFIERLKKYKFTPSYSRKGCPYDNACIESFHSILKKEEVNNVKYYDFNSAKFALFQFIESWYNRRRIHSTICYLTPQKCEEQARKSS
jgi:putative transposase